MNNVQYLKDNIVQVKELLADAEERAKNGEQFLDATIHTYQRHLADLKNQLAEAEKGLAAVG